MKKGFIIVSLVFLLLLSGFSGCLDENTASIFAEEMEEKYNKINNYRAKVNNTAYSEFTQTYIKTIEKPDKLRFEYLTPDYRDGDLQIINGSVEYRYDASKNIAYKDTYSINFGEENLENPNFLEMLLFLVKNADIETLPNEQIINRDAKVVEVVPKIKTTFSKWKIWFDLETYFPLKWITYDNFGEISYTKTIEEFEINIDLSDDCFELPEYANITTELVSSPKTIEECEGRIGLEIILPSYLPEGYSVDEDFSVGSLGYSISGDGTVKSGYIQNNIMVQRMDFLDYITITYRSTDTYAEVVNLTSGEVVGVLNKTNTSITIDNCCDTDSINVEHYGKQFRLYETTENALKQIYGSKITDEREVSINNNSGEYFIVQDTGQYGEVVYETAIISWNLDEYWLLLAAGGNSILSSEELVKIAESIIK